jgi:dienelactone hydrolase
MVALIIFALSPTNVAAAKCSGNFASDGPHAVDTSYDTWTDDRRQRSIPVKIYRPIVGGPRPVVIFSHGLGGSREAAGYLGTGLASWGILAIHAQHPGSDREVWRGITWPRAIRKALAKAVRNRQNAIDRFEDMPFIIDEISRRASAGQLPVNLSQIGVAGHSFGAHSVLAAVGRLYPERGNDRGFADKRIRAGVALSPPAPGQRVSAAALKLIYSKIATPLLHLTGDNDKSPINASVKPANRLIPFERIDRAPQYAVVFKGGDHMVFSGRKRAWKRRSDRRIQDAVMYAATVFFLAYLVDDDAARRQLNGPAFGCRFDEGDRVLRRNVE